MLLAGLLALGVGLADVPRDGRPPRRPAAARPDRRDARRARRTSVETRTRDVHRVRGRRGRRQVDPGEAAGDLAARARPRRRAHPRARRHARSAPPCARSCSTIGRTTRRRGRRRCSTQPTAPSTSTPSSAQRSTRGADVITDRYLDSSIAYQAAGRQLAADEVARLSSWATRGLRPDLTVLLDVAPTDRAGAVRDGAGPAGERVAGVPRARTGGVPGAGPRSSGPLPRARREPAGRRAAPADPRAARAPCCGPGPRQRLPRQRGRAHWPQVRTTT